jgi:hypothetical protein
MGTDESPRWFIRDDTWWDRRRRYFQDSFLGVKRLQEGIEKGTGQEITDDLNTYLIEEQYHGKAMNEADKFDKRYVEPIRKFLTDNKIKLEDYEDFLYARHAGERNFMLEQERVTRPRIRLEKEKAELEKKPKAKRNYDRIKEIDSELAEIKKTAKDFPDSGMSDKEAAAIIKKFTDAGLLKIESVKKHRNGNIEVKYSGTLARGGRLFDRLTRFKMDRLLRDGLISEEDYNTILDRYNYYAPLKGREDLDDISISAREAGYGKGYDIRREEIQRAYGRKTRATRPILATAVVDAETAIIRGLKNEVGKSLLKMAERFPNKKVWEINKVVNKWVYNKNTGEIETVKDQFSNERDNVLSVKRDGQEWYITLHDDRLASAMKNLGVENLNKWVKVHGKAQRVLAALSTSYNPEFIMSNFLRDIQTAGFNLSEEDTKKFAGRVLKNTPNAIRGIWAEQLGKEGKEGDYTVDSGFWKGLIGKDWKEFAQYYQEYKDSGAAIGFFGMTDVESKMKEIVRQIKNTGPDPKARGYRAFKAMAGFIEGANKGVENGVRLATYVEARKAGLSKLKAASLARNITVNFNRKGEGGPLVNAMYMFANAGLQGSTRLLAGISRSPRLKKFAGGVAFSAASLAFYNRMAGGKDEDDEWYIDKVPEYIKSKNTIIMIPGTDGKYVKLPAPYGYNVLLTIGNEMEKLVTTAFGLTNESFSDATVSAAANITNSFLDAFNPLGSARIDTMHGIARNISPTLFDFVVDILSNKNFFGGQIAKEPKFEKDPRSQIFWNASEPSKQFAEFLNKATGGDEWRSGLLDWPPEMIDYVTQSMFGGAGKTGLLTAEAVRAWFSGESVPVHKIPFVRRLFGDQSPYATSDLFWSAMDELDAVKRQQSDSEGNNKAIRELKRDHGWKLRFLDEVKEIRKELKTVKNDPDKELEIQKRFLKRWNQAKERAR